MGETGFPGMAQLLAPESMPEDDEEGQEVGFPAFFGRHQEKAEKAALVRIVGERLRQARELCNLSQSAAAKLLGYSNPSKLSKVEGATDTNSVPLWLILRAVKVYGVTTGFLLGTEEADASQAVSVLRASNLWLAEALEKARERDLAAIESVRGVALTGAKHAEALAVAALAVHEALDGFIQRNRQFTQAPASATLVYRIEELARLAKTARANLRRAGVAQGA